MPVPESSVPALTDDDSDPDYVPSDNENSQNSASGNNVLKPPQKKKQRNQAGRKMDPVWSHFSKTGVKNQQSCNGCSYTINYPQPDRLRNHLIKCPKSKNKQLPSDVLSVPVPNLFVPVPEQVEASSSSSIALPTKMKQSEIRKYFVNTTTNQKIELDGRLIKFVCSANVPFTIVDNPEFIALVQALRPSYKMPVSKTISGPLLDQTYIEIKAKVAVQINNKKGVLLQDGWQSPQGEAVIAHSLYVEGQHYMIDAQAAGVNGKTGEFCLSRFDEAMKIASEDYNVEIIGLVTDNCNTMRKLQRLVSLKYPDLLVYGCNSHLFNNIGKDLTPPIVDEVVAVQKYFKNHDLPAAALKKLGGTRPVIPNDTRWNSQLDAFRSFRNNQAKYLDLSRKPNICDSMTSEIKATISNGTIFEKINQALLLLEPIAFSLDTVSSQNWHWHVKTALAQLTFCILSSVKETKLQFQTLFIVG
jgi:hypothetical protein